MHETPGTDGRRRGEPPPPGTLVPRQSLGAAPQPYIVRDTLGSGGMGVVMLATDQDLNRPVALKIMWDARDTVAARRFAFEAEVTAQLDHPGIVPVHERGVDARGRPYYTMRLVRGRSLAEILESQAQGNPGAIADYPLARMVRILVEVANAVAYAHDRGVIHRDLKPHNIMVGRYGEVQVMDWGLARMLDRPEPEETGRAGTGPVGRGGTSVAATIGATQITVHGTVRGTPAYMPPEQARGETWRLDRQSDVYALGAILYEILTLTPPFQAESSQAILELVAAGDLQPPHERAPGREIPRALAAVVEKAMAWHPADRYATAGELRHDLEAWLDGRAVSAHQETPWEAAVRLWRRYHIVATAIALGFALTIGAVSVAFVSNLQARREAERAKIAADRLLAEARAQGEADASLRLRVAPALLARARDDLGDGRIDDARRSIDDALACNADLTEARLLLAALLAVEGRGEQARQEVRQILAKDPEHPEARRWRTALDQGLPGTHPELFRDLLMRAGILSWAEAMRQGQRRPPR